MLDKIALVWEHEKLPFVFAIMKLILINNY